MGGNLVRLVSFALVLAAGSPAFAGGDTPQRVSVVVAAHDLSAGTKITYDDIAQQAIPAPFVTRSHVKPEDVKYIVGQTVLVPVLTGELMRWQFFESYPAAHLETCKRALGDPGTPAQQVARARRAVVGPARK